MKSPCFWDGGAALAYPKDDNRWYLHGVNTGGPVGVCALDDFPSLYIRTTEYLQWIAKTIAEN